MTLDELYERVTGAIVRAERIVEADSLAHRRAYLEVSELEDQIAKILPAGDPEGAVARRGAVRAAVTAGDILRAETLVSEYLDRGDVPDQLEHELDELIEVGRLAAARNDERVVVAPGARFTFHEAA